MSCWVDCFLALQPFLVCLYDMCDFYIINDPGFAMITHLRAAAQNGWCLHYFYSICWFEAIQPHWFVVRWLITYVLLHFCMYACPFSLWLESFILAVCSGHGCMTQEKPFLELWKALWVWRKVRWALLNTVENNMALLPPRHSCLICRSVFLHSNFFFSRQVKINILSLNLFIFLNFFFYFFFFSVQHTIMFLQF